jgi:hypothetical protein
MGMNETPETRPKKRRWRTYSVLLAIIFVCSMPWDLWFFVRPALTPQPDGKNTYEEFAAAIKSYPYEASQARKDRIVKSFPRLAAGMSKDQIAALIGDPDYSQLDYGPKGPGEKWLGSSWTYWLHKRDDGVNMNDPCLEIFFGTDGRANWIVPTSIDGLKEKGGVSRADRPPNTDKP